MITVTDTADQTPSCLLDNQLLHYTLYLPTLPPVGMLTWLSGCNLSSLVPSTTHRLPFNRVPLTQVLPDTQATAANQLLL